MTSAALASIVLQSWYLAFERAGPTNGHQPTFVAFGTRRGTAGNSGAFEAHELACRIDSHSFTTRQGGHLVRLDGPLDQSAARRASVNKDLINYAAQHGIPRTWDHSPSKNSAMSSTKTDSTTRTSEAQLLPAQTPSANGDARKLKKRPRRRQSGRGGSRDTSEHGLSSSAADPMTTPPRSTFQRWRHLHYEYSARDDPAEEAGQAENLKPLEEPPLVAQAGDVSRQEHSSMREQAIGAEENPTLVAEEPLDRGSPRISDVKRESTDAVAEKDVKFLSANSEGSLTLVSSAPSPEQSSASEIRVQLPQDSTGSDSAAHADVTPAVPATQPSDLDPASDSASTEHLVELALQEEPSEEKPDIAENLDGEPVDLDRASLTREETPGGDSATSASAREPQTPEPPAPEPTADVQANTPDDVTPLFSSRLPIFTRLFQGSPVDAVSAFAEEVVNFVNDDVASSQSAAVMPDFEGGSTSLDGFEVNLSPLPDLESEVEQFFSATNGTAQDPITPGGVEERTGVLSQSAMRGDDFAVAEGGEHAPVAPVGPFADEAQNSAGDVGADDLAHGEPAAKIASEDEGALSTLHRLHTSEPIVEPEFETPVAESEVPPPVANVVSTVPVLQDAVHEDNAEEDGPDVTPSAEQTVQARSASTRNPEETPSLIRSPRRTRVNGDGQLDAIGVSAESTPRSSTKRPRARSSNGTPRTDFWVELTLSPRRTPKSASPRKSRNAAGLMASPSRVKQTLFVEESTELQPGQDRPTDVAGDATEPTPTPLEEGGPGDLDVADEELPAGNDGTNACFPKAPEMTVQEQPLQPVVQAPSQRDTPFNAVNAQEEEKLLAGDAPDSPARNEDHDAVRTTAPASPEAPRLRSEGEWPVEECPATIDLSLKTPRTRSAKRKAVVMDEDAVSPTPVRKRKRRASQSSSTARRRVVESADEGEGEGDAQSVEEPVQTAETEGPDQSEPEPEPSPPEQSVKRKRAGSGPECDHKETPVPKAKVPAFIRLSRRQASSPDSGLDSSVARATRSKALVKSIVDEAEEKVKRVSGESSQPAKRGRRQSSSRASAGNNSQPQPPSTTETNTPGVRRSRRSKADSTGPWWTLEHAQQSVARDKEALKSLRAEQRELEALEGGGASGQGRRSRSTSSRPMTVERSAEARDVEEAGEEEDAEDERAANVEEADPPNAGEQTESVERAEVANVVTPERRKPPQRRRPLCQRIMATSSPDPLARVSPIKRARKESGSGGGGSSSGINRKCRKRS